MKNATVNVETIEVVITDSDYELYIKEAGNLVQSDPEPESSEGIRLRILVFLICEYEKKLFTIE